MAKLISSSLEIVRQGNTGDKGQVITYHRGMGGGVGGFGAKHGETSPIPALNLISLNSAITPHNS